MVTYVNTNILITDQILCKINERVTYRYGQLYPKISLEHYLYEYIIVSFILNKIHVVHIIFLCKYNVYNTYFSIKCLLLSVKWLRPWMLEDEKNKLTKLTTFVLSFTNIRSLSFFTSELSNLNNTLRF